MSQHKVPQDVEAEDHILGPLTFRQFIYSMIGTGWALICFALFRPLPVLLFAVGLPPTFLFLMLAFYRRDGQSFEQLLIAMAGFFAAPHRRLWVKDDAAETFHIAPVKQAAERTQRDPAKVLSELEKLSTLIDSRGWNVPINRGAETNPALALPSTQHADRIVATPPPPPHPDEPAADMLDLKNSPLAQDLGKLLQQASAEVRAEAINQMSNPTPSPILQAQSLQTSARSDLAKPTPRAQALESISGVTTPPTSDILKLATQSDHLSVAQVANQASRLIPLTEGQTMEIHQNAS